MPRAVISTLRESLFWSYANLAMAHAAVTAGATAFAKSHFMIRARLYSRLTKGTMGLGSIIEDERLKMVLPQACSYCGSSTSLSVDHLLPKSRGGLESGDNIVWACKSCNSSKGAADVLEWMQAQGRFPPLLLLRRYLKLAVEYSDRAGLLDRRIADTPVDVPFSITAIPHKFPAPSQLVLWACPQAERAKTSLNPNP